MRSGDISGNDQTKARPKEKIPNPSAPCLASRATDGIIWTKGLGSPTPPVLCLEHIRFSFWPVPFSTCNFSQ